MSDPLLLAGSMDERALLLAAALRERDACSCFSLAGALVVLLLVASAATGGFAGGLWAGSRPPSSAGPSR